MHVIMDHLNYKYQYITTPQVQCSNSKGGSILVLNGATNVLTWESNFFCHTLFRNKTSEKTYNNFHVIHFQNYINISYFHNLNQVSVFYNYHISFAVHLASVYCQTSALFFILQRQRPLNVIVTHRQINYL